MKMANEDAKDKLIKQLQSQVERLENENLMLRAEIKTRDSMSYIADPRGIAQRTVNQMKELHIETERLKIDNNRLTRAIGDFLDVSRNYYQEKEEKVDEWITYLNDVAEQRPLPHLVAAIQNAAIELADDKVDLFDSATQRAIEKLHLESTPDEDLLDPYNHPGLCLGGAWSYLAAASIRESMVYYAMKAYGLAHDPKLVCEEIMRQCQRKAGEPDIKYVMLLPIEWIQNNLPDPPAKHTTLTTGLRNVQTWLNTGRTKQQYYTDTGFPERTLKQAEGWYDVIKQHALAAQQLPWRENA
jgi:hypothetical protein